jgi:hypothetical protein
MNVSLAVLAGVLAAALLSMAVFAATGARRDPDAERRNSRFLMGAGDFLVHWLLWAIRPLDRIAASLGLSPDFFNFAGLFFGSRKTKARPDAYSAYDLFVVVSAYTPFYRSLRAQGRLRHHPALGAALNAWLPPNQVSLPVTLADGTRVLA